MTGHLLVVFSNLLAHQARLLRNGIQGTGYRVYCMVLISNHHLLVGKNSRQVPTSTNKRRLYLLLFLCPGRLVIIPVLV